MTPATKKIHTTNENSFISNLGFIKGRFLKNFFWFWGMRKKRRRKTTEKDTTTFLLIECIFASDNMAWRDPHVCAGFLQVCVKFFKQSLKPWANFVNAFTLLLRLWITGYFFVFCVRNYYINYYYAIAFTAIDDTLLADSKETCNYSYGNQWKHSVGLKYVRYTSSNQMLVLNSDTVSTSNHRNTKPGCCIAFWDIRE